MIYGTLKLRLQKSFMICKFLYHIPLCIMRETANLVFLEFPS